MNHGNGKNLIEPAANSGIDPETAANDIRAILDAGGKGAGILAQRGALLEWAERAGRRYRESFWIAEARVRPSRLICSLNRGAGRAEIGCRRQARRALRTGRSANQILIVDEVLAVGDAEFQKNA